MREFYDTAALVLQIHIIHKYKHSYAQRDIWTWTERSYAVIYSDTFEGIMTFLQEVTRLSCDNDCWLGKQPVGSQKCLPDFLWKELWRTIGWNGKPKILSSDSLWGIFMLYPCAELQHTQCVNLREGFSFLLVTSWLANLQKSPTWKS